MNIDRMILAAVLILATMAIIGITLAANTTQISLLFISGIIGLVIGDGALFFAFREIGPRITLLIMSFNPAVAAILAFFTMGETLGPAAIAGMALTIGGIAIVILEKPKSDSLFKVNAKGVIFSIIGASGQAVGLVFTKMAFQAGPLHEFTATFYRLLGSILFMLPLCIIFNRYANPVRVYRTIKHAFGLIVLAAVIGPYLGVTLQFIAVVNTEVGIASTLLSTAPIMMLPLSRIIYKEKISLISALGAFLAVGGMVMLFLW